MFSLKCQSALAFHAAVNAFEVESGAQPLPPPQPPVMYNLPSELMNESRSISLESDNGGRSNGRSQEEEGANLELDYDDNEHEMEAWSWLESPLDDGTV